ARRAQHAPSLDRAEPDGRRGRKAHQLAPVRSKLVKQSLQFLRLHTVHDSSITRGPWPAAAVRHLGHAARPEHVADLLPPFGITSERVIDVLEPAQATFEDCLVGTVRIDLKLGLIRGHTRSCGDGLSKRSLS